MAPKHWKPGNGSIAVLLAVAAAIILVATAPAIGLTWDEPAYIAGAEGRAGWFGVLRDDFSDAFKKETLDEYWSVTHEHPPLDMTWSGLIWTLGKSFFDDLTAHRLGNMLLVALMTGMLYYMIAEAYGKAAGLFAAAALLSMPRFFFHAHLAALDVPVAAAVFAVTFLFWRTIDRRGWGWGFVLGIAWGLALAVKLNAVFLPVALVLWFLLFRREEYVALRLSLMVESALPVFVAVWPWLYHDTLGRIVEYMNFHLHHVEIGQFYFGQNYTPPPWHFVPVILWAVLPLGVTAMFLTGVVRSRSGRQDGGLGWLLVFSALVSVAPFLFEKNLLYDNDRLFMPVYPFLAGLAGIGFGWIWDGLRGWWERRRRPVPAAVLGCLFAAVLILPQSLAMGGLYPHLLSYYSAGVGGLPGATKLGLETTYWCESYAAAIPYINEHAKPGDSIWVENWSHDILIFYQTRGVLRSDLKILAPYSGLVSILGPDAPTTVQGGYRDADWIIVQYRQTQFAQWDYGSDFKLFLQAVAPPVFKMEYQGIPIMELYKQ